MASEPGPLPETDAAGAEESPRRFENRAAQFVFPGCTGCSLRRGCLSWSSVVGTTGAGTRLPRAVPVLRVFALWIPLTGLCTVVTFQLILPSQLDSQFNIVNFTAALVNILAALLLGPPYGAIGIAWSAVIGQIYTLLAFAVILWRAGLNPFPLSIIRLSTPARLGRRRCHFATGTTRIPATLRSR